MNSLLLLMGVSLAGGMGAAARYVIDFAIMQRAGSDVPWGIFAVNMTGSLALGLLVGLAMRSEISAELSILIGGGFLGAFTTFSTWMYESVRLLEQGKWRTAAMNLMGSLVMGVSAAALGVAAGAVLAGGA